MTFDDQEEDKSAQRNSPTLSNNDDLRELCFVLDAERNKMHELAEQWKQFGTSTIYKLECQIVDYQEKLNELEQRQILLLNENESLKSFINQMMMTTNADDNLLKDVIYTDISPSFSKLNLFYFRLKLFKMPQLKPILKNMNLHIIYVFIDRNPYMIV